VLSIGIFFSLMIIGLSATLSSTLTAGLISHGVPATVAHRIGALPPVSVLFAAFLGYNPIKTLVGSKVLGHVSAANQAALTGHGFFSRLISAPFHSGIKTAFIFSAVVSVIAAGASWSRGSRFVNDGRDQQLAAMLEKPEATTALQD
jgi:hypothetical protein